MATADLVILSSSPQAAARHATRSPSPAPSPVEVLKRKPPTTLRSGSKSVQIPNGAVTGFTSAAQLIRDMHFTLGDDTNTDDIPTSAQRPRDYIEPELETPLSPKKTSRKGVKKAIKSNSIDTETFKPPRKRKSSPQKKAATAKGTKKSRPEPSTHTTESDLPTEPLPPPPVTPTKILNPVRMSEGLGLDAALKRRTDWTPPKDTVEQTFESIDDFENPPGLEDNFVANQTANPKAVGEQGTLPSLDSSSKNLNFVSLVNNYSYSVPISADQSNPRTPGDVGIKPSHIESVHLPQPLPQVASPLPISATRTKKPKKKARTITEIATKNYGTLAEHGTVESTTESNTVENTHEAPIGEPEAGNLAISATKPAGAKKRGPRKRTSGETSTKSKKASKVTKKKKASPVPQLLSPETAAQRFNGQDLLFGTSSQLAREDSPTYLREFQRAIQESEAITTFDDSNQGDTFGSRLSLARQGRGLWSAAARDLDNEMLQVDKPQQDEPNKELLQFDESNLAKPAPDSHDATSRAANESHNLKSVNANPQLQCSPSKPESPGDVKEDSGFLDIDEMDELEPSAPLAPLSKGTSFEDIEDIEDELKNINAQEKVVLKKSRTNATTSKPSQGRGRGRVLSNVSSNGTGTSNTVLEEVQASSKSRKAAANTSKAPRGRPRKIPPTAPANTVQDNSSKLKAAKFKEPVTVQSPRTVAKKIVTPKKIKKTDWTHIDEIEDSEDDCKSLSPVSISRDSPCTRPRVLDLSPSRHSLTLDKDTNLPSATKKTPREVQFTSNSITSNKFDWELSFVTLFPLITATIKSSPPATNPSNISWYEKILLYDPIILEDFTDWLNKEGVKVKGKKGEMEEVQSWMIQKWCESNSVCCFWRDGGWNSRRAMSAR